MVDESLRTSEEIEEPESCKGMGELILDRVLFPGSMQGEGMQEELDAHLGTCTACKEKLDFYLAIVAVLDEDRTDCPDAETLTDIVDAHPDDLDKWIGSVDRAKIARGTRCDDDGCHMEPLSTEDHVRICHHCREELLLIRETLKDLEAILAEREVEEAN